MSKRVSWNALVVLALVCPAAALAQTITGITNNYSYIPDGFPNSGISPGSIFTLYGSDMSTAPATVTLQSSASPGIPTKLEGATLTVTVGGFAAHPAMYYATPSQIAAVLPSDTPVGAATITVSYTAGRAMRSRFRLCLMLWGWIPTTAPVPVWLRQRTRPRELSTTTRIRRSRERPSFDGAPDWAPTPRIAS